MKRLLPVLLLFVFAATSLGQSPTVKITISPETTYETQCKLPDGRIDYFAAINKPFQSSVAKDNNIVAGLFSLTVGEAEMSLIKAKAKGDPASENEHLVKYRQRFWKMLGDEQPPELDSLVCPYPYGGADIKQQLIADYGEKELAEMLEAGRQGERDYCKTRFEEKKMSEEEYQEEIRRINEGKSDMHIYHNIGQEEWYEALSKKWTEKNYPRLAKWIASTDDLTQKLIAISKRTEYYHPYLSYNENDKLLFQYMLPYAQGMRETARFFQMRSNWEFVNGRFDQAMECAFSAVRLGQTMRKGSGCIVEDLVGVAMIGIGNFQITKYLVDPDLKQEAGWFLKKQKEYDAIYTQIGPFPVPPFWPNSERLSVLSAIQLMAYEPKSIIDFYREDGYDEESVAKFDKLFNSGIEYDWDEILRQTNTLYDELEDISALPSMKRQLRASKRLEKRIADEFEQSKTNTALTPEQQAVLYIREYYFCSVNAMLNATTRAIWERRITHVAFSLAAYRADHGGANPDSLDQLVPKYLESVPLSPFTDEPLRYVKRENDCLIASDNAYKLDGTETKLEEMIAEAPAGERRYPDQEHFIFIVGKGK